MNSSFQSLFLPPNRSKLIMGICFIPILIYIYLHMSEIKMIYTYALLGGATGGTIVLIWEGGKSFKITSSGIEAFRFGIPSRFIPWSTVSLIVIDKQSSSRKEWLLIVLNGCHYQVRLSPSLKLFHEFHPFRTIFIDYGCYLDYLQRNFVFESVQTNNQTYIMKGIRAIRITSH